MTLGLDRVASALPAYEVGGELGRGAWGLVLEGRHRHLGRAVAIKQLPRAFGANPVVRARFVVEARVLASLDHPHIVRVFDYVEADDLCLLVMEKLDGGTLWERFVTKGLTMESSCALTLATAAGLQAAHEKGILHRDIKPENLMFSANGTLKVTDFGIAKMVAGSMTMGTRAGEVLGTPAYMAPEHVGRRTLGPPTDVYAAGVMLYELLSGRLPFPDDGEPIAVLYQHVHEEPPDLRELAPDVPEALAGVVMRALAKDPDERYATAEAFAVALASTATATWGPGWPSRRGRVTIMATGPILTATEVPPVGAGSDPPAPPSTPPDEPHTAPVRASVAAHAGPSVTGESSLAELVPIPDLAATVAVPRPPERRRRPRAVVIVLAAVVLATGVVFGLLSSGDDESPEESLPGSVLVPEETFTNAFGGWSQSQQPEGSVGYADGVYRIFVIRPNYMFVSDIGSADPGLEATSDVAVEAEAADVSPVDGTYGLVCRRQPDGRAYAAALDSAGFAQISRIGPDGGVLMRSDAPVAAGDADTMRTLRLECVGAPGRPATLRLFVGGDQVAEATDAESLPGGRAGLVASSRAESGLEVVFDNFVVHRATSPGG